MYIDDLMEKPNCSLIPVFIHWVINVLSFSGELFSVLGPSARHQISFERLEFSEQADGPQRKQDH